MLNFTTIYSISFKKMLKKPMFYIVSALAIFVSFFITIFIPMISLGGISVYYESDTWTHLLFASFVSVIGIFSAIIGELNAVNNEKIYFLSKPIKRSTFLIGKCLVSFTWSIIIFIICSLMLVIISVVEITKYHENIFNSSHGNNVFSIFISFVIVCMFCSVCTTIWAYLFRQAYSVILFATLVILYAVLFPMFLQLDEGDFDNKTRLLWVTLPIGIFVILTIIFSWVGTRFFMRSEIES